jgi:hypothetical protein
MSRMMRVWVTPPPGDPSAPERWSVESLAELRRRIVDRFGAASDRFDLLHSSGSRWMRFLRAGRRELLVVPRIAGGEENTEKVFLEIPKDLIKEPIIHTLGIKFKVVPNIRAGSITETLARIALELTGDPDEVSKAVEYIKGLGIVVEPIGEK